MARINVADLDKLAAHKYRWARVLEVHSDWDTVDIELLDAQGQPTGEQWQDVPLFYHCRPDAQLRENGALKGAAAAFEANCEVIVELDGFQEVRRVVARRDGLKACATGAFPVVVSDYLAELQCLTPPVRAAAHMQVKWVDEQGVGAPPGGDSEEVQNLEISVEDAASVAAFKVNGVTMSGLLWTYSDYPETGTPTEIEVIQEDVEGRFYSQFQIRVKGKCKGEAFEYLTRPINYYELLVKSENYADPAGEGTYYRSEVLCPGDCYVYTHHTDWPYREYTGFIWVDERDYVCNVPEEVKTKEHEWGVAEQFDSQGCTEGCMDLLVTNSVEGCEILSYQGCYAVPHESHERYCSSSFSDQKAKLQTRCQDTNSEYGIEGCSEIPTTWMHWDTETQSYQPGCPQAYEVSWDEWPYNDDPVAPADFIAWFSSSSQSEIAYWLDYFGLPTPTQECYLVFTETPEELRTGGF